MYHYVHDANCLSKHRHPVFIYVPSAAETVLVRVLPKRHLTAESALRHRSAERRQLKPGSGKETAGGLRKQECRLLLVSAHVGGKQHCERATLERGRRPTPGHSPNLVFPFRVVVSDISRPVYTGQSQGWTPETRPGSLWESEGKQASGSRDVAEEGERITNLAHKKRTTG